MYQALSQEAESATAALTMIGAFLVQCWLEALFLRHLWSLSQFYLDKSSFAIYMITPRRVRCLERLYRVFLWKHA